MKKLDELDRLSGLIWSTPLKQFSHRTTDHLIPFQSEFEAYIFPPSTREFWIVWVPKSKERMLFAFPVLKHQKRFSRQEVHLVYFGILQERGTLLSF